MTVSPAEKNLIEMVADYISVAKYLTVLSGHAVSTESGVPPLQLTDEERWDPQIERFMQGYELFQEDPEEYWKLHRNPPDFFKNRRRLQETAQPNPVHLAMKELEDLEAVKFLVTEAPDGLYRKAGFRNLTEIHGNIHKMRCGRCSARYERDEFDNDDVPPRCPACQGYIKTDVVHFGEPIPEDVLQLCNDEASRSDMMLVVGSTAEIYPAAALPLMIKQKGGRLAEINQVQTSISLSCDVSLRGKPSELLPLLVEAVKKRA